MAAGNAAPSGRPGGQQQYCDLAIITTLTLRSVFHLALRQTEGLVASLLRLMNLDLATPDHTTLSRPHDTVPTTRHCPDYMTLSRPHDTVPAQGYGGGTGSCREPCWP